MFFMLPLDDNYFQSVIEYVDEQIDSGRYDKSRPPFQTHSQLHRVPLFAPLVKDALKQACEFLQNPFVSLMWCYVEWAGFVPHYEPRGAWHCHSDCLTAVFYLQNVELIGTEFLDGSFLCPHPRQWIFMDGLEYHRPPVTKTDARRYTLALNVNEGNGKTISQSVREHYVN
jgi:hypothetical protein